VTSIYILGVMCYTKRYKGTVKRNLSIHDHNMRSKLNFHVDFCITVLVQKSVVNVGIKLYNTVPEFIKKWIPLNSLKKELKPLKLSCSFYSVDKFLQF
jgi:hypothetical protein